MSSPSILKSLSPLLSALFIDFFGFVILICYLPILFSDSSFSIFSSHSTQERYFLFSLFLATFSLFQCIGNLFFSRMIQHENSRLFLILSYVGNCSGYLLCSLALFTKTPYLLYVGNALAGFLGTTLTGTQTSIANLSAQQEQFKGFNWGSLCIGAAFLSAPPLFSLVLPSIHTGFMPCWSIFISCAILSLISACTIALFVPRHDVRFKLRADPLEKASRFSSRERLLYLATFLFGCGWSIFIKFFQFHLLENHNISDASSCRLMVFFGVGVLISQITLALGSFKSSLGRSFNLSIFVCSFLIFCINFTSGYVPIATNLVLIAISYAFIQSCMPLISIHLLEKKSPGKTVALYQSALALGKVIAPLLGGFILFYFHNMPFILSTLFMLCSLGVFLFSLETGSLKWETSEETT